MTPLAPLPPDPVINGQLLLSLGAFVRKKYGRKGYDELATAVPFDYDAVTAERYYPLSHPVAAMDHCEGVYGLDSLRQAGRFAVKNIGMKRFFAVFTTPDTIFARIEQTFGKMNTRVTVHRTDTATGTTLELRGVLVRRVMVEFWQGMFEGALELTKTAGTVRVEPGWETGDERVVYHIDWR